MNKFAILNTYFNRNNTHMSSAEITIIKRDGKRKAFSVEKIKNAIRKAFLSVGAFATEEDLVLRECMWRKSRTRWRSP